MKPSVLSESILELAAHLSQLKEDQYSQLTVLDSLIELLAAKGVLTPEELSRQVQKSESMLELGIDCDHSSATL